MEQYDDGASIAPENLSRALREPNQDSELLQRYESEIERLSQRVRGKTDRIAMLERTIERLEKAADRAERVNAVSIKALESENAELREQLAAQTTQRSEPSDSAKAPRQEEAENAEPREQLKWTDENLIRLLEESEEPNVTQKSLADKYGVSRQRIGEQLAKARALKTRKKSSPMRSWGNKLV